MVCTAMPLEKEPVFRVLFGARQAYFNQTFTCFSNQTTSTPTVSCRRGASGVTWTADCFGQITTYSITPSAAILNNFSAQWDNPHSFEKAPTSLVLGAGRSDLSIIYPFVGRIYSAKISEGTEIVRNFIPCLDDTGTPCMYDTVSHTAFYNQGASAEEGGKDFLYKLSVPETKQLPYGYYPLSYLESTGTQWIDTGIKLSNESVVSCECATLFEHNGALRALFGARTIDTDNQFAFFVGTGNEMYHGRRMQEVLMFNPEEKGQRFRVVITPENCSVDNYSKNWTKNGTFETVENAIFGCRYSTGFAAPSIARIYSFSISCAGVLQLDFQPCLDDRGVPCMYDFVSGKSFYNKSTGANFLYEIPAEIAMLPATMALREEKVEYGILTENGLRRLYHPAKKLYFLPAQLTAYALENGYKPIIENEKPTDGNWTPVWTETEDEIILTWEEINEDEFAENR